MASKLPEETALKEIAREIEFLAGLREAQAQARRGGAIPAEGAQKLLENGPAGSPYAPNSKGSPRNRRLVGSG
jgi:hypothetical protein